MTRNRVLAVIGFVVFCAFVFYWAWVNVPETRISIPQINVSVDNYATLRDNPETARATLCAVMKYEAHRSQVSLDATPFEIERADVQFYFLMKWALGQGCTFTELELEEKYFEELETNLGRRLFK